MFEYHVALGLSSLVLSVVGHALYIRSIFAYGVKPHPFTWLLFTVLDGTVFLVQFLNGGGPGAWLLGLTTVFGGIVFLISIAKGEKRIARIDWICLLAAFLGIVTWIATKNPLYAVLIACITELIAKAPTFRKSYLRPHEESLTIWISGIINFTLAISALTSITFTTALFPLVIIITNVMLVAMILLRRRKLGRVAA